MGLCRGGDGGVKIGYTKRAGRCLVSSATQSDTQLISVVLNDEIGLMIVID